MDSGSRLPALQSGVRVRISDCGLQLATLKKYKAFFWFKRRTILDHFGMSRSAAALKQAYQQEMDEMQKQGEKKDSMLDMLFN